MDSRAEGRGRVARIQRRLIIVEVEKRIMQYQIYVDQGLEKEAHCMFGLVLYSLDRLLHAVKGHAKETGEWQYIKFKECEFDRVLTSVIMNSLRQDIIDLAKPGLQTAYKLRVTSRLERMYDCLLPSLKRQ
ncbi:hypothetical protein WN944_009720 [Citrus x changshan-huyou]|uniref:Uncharacterized protein n=1 Tax=Citrus x changshan-huyou TaxID=2935761 RepID=A0AAP0R010_9ROSI